MGKCYGMMAHSTEEIGTRANKVVRAACYCLMDLSERAYFKITSTWGILNSLTLSSIKKLASKLMIRQIKQLIKRKRK